MPEENGVFSARALTEAEVSGRIKIEDVLLCPSPPRICSFKAKVGWFFLAKTRFLDPRAASIQGNSLKVRDVFLDEPPGNSFPLSNQGWLLDGDGNRMGDVLDFLVNAKLKIREVVASLNHELILPKDERESLPQEKQDQFMKSIPDATSLGGGAYTAVSVPITRVTKIETDPLYYEVITDVLASKLKEELIDELGSGEAEEGLLREVFRRMAA